MRTLRPTPRRSMATFATQPDRRSKTHSGQPKNDDAAGQRCVPSKRWFLREAESVGMAEWHLGNSLPGMARIMARCDQQPSLPVTLHHVLRHPID